MHERNPQGLSATIPPGDGPFFVKLVLMSRPDAASCDELLDPIRVVDVETCFRIVSYAPVLNPLL